MLSPPVVLMTTDDDLAVGEFGIATRMVQQRSARQDAEPVPDAQPGQTMVYRPTEGQEDSEAEGEVARETVALLEGQTKHEITKPVTVLGRSAGCDVRLDDPNVSRRHAELRQQGTSYWIVDLGSTNGVDVNGARVERSKLDHGDTVTLGESELVFMRELP
jgi:pSer/pThr/pTyr-binding forkhead associated (FHA) protein